MHSQRCHFSAYPFRLPVSSSCSKPASCQWGIPNPTVRNIFQMVPDLGQSRHLINRLEWMNMWKLSYVANDSQSLDSALLRSGPLLMRVVMGGHSEHEASMNLRSRKNCLFPKVGAGEVTKPGKRVWPGHTGQGLRRGGGAQGQARGWKGQEPLRCLMQPSWLQLQGFQEQMAWEDCSQMPTEGAGVRPWWTGTGIFENETPLWPTLKSTDWASLAAQGIGICPPMQETWVRSLVREDPTCCGVKELVHHWPVYPNYWACVFQNLGAQLPRPCVATTEARTLWGLCSKRGHRNKKLTHHN